MTQHIPVFGVHGLLLVQDIRAPPNSYVSKNLRQHGTSQHIRMFREPGRHVEFSLEMPAGGSDCQKNTEVDITSSSATHPSATSPL